MSALFSAYQEWCAANPLDETASVSRAVMRAKLVPTGKFDHRQEGAGAFPRLGDGALFLGHLQRCLSGQKEGSLRAVDGITQSAKDSIDHPGVIGVAGKSDSNVDDNPRHDHGRGLFGSEIGNRVHVILRGLIAHIRVLFLGRVE